MAEILKFNHEIFQLFDNFMFRDIFKHHLRLTNVDFLKLSVFKRDDSTLFSREDPTESSRSLRRFRQNDLRVIYVRWPFSLRYYAREAIFSRAFTLAACFEERVERS